MRTTKLLRLTVLGATALCLVWSEVRAQVGFLGEGSGTPSVDLTASGENSFKDGVATASGDVQLLYGDVSIYCEKLVFDTVSGWIRAEESVRIYPGDGTIWRGDRFNYNVRTKELDADHVKFVQHPVVGGAEKLRTITGPDGTPLYEAQFGLFTTENVENPGFKLKPRSITYDPIDNRYVMKNAVVYAGSVPIFWVPHVVYNPGGPDMAFQFTPGYKSDWGAFLLTAYGTEIMKGLYSKVHLDYRTSRGVAVGNDLRWIYGKREEGEGEEGEAEEGEFGQGQASVYVAFDQDPEGDGPTSPFSPSFFQEGGGDPEDRYRLKLQQRAYFTDEKDIYFDVSVNKLSDKRMERDFFEADFRKERQPDNMAQLVKQDENFQVTLLARQQFNDFFETAEREPELLVELKRQRLVSTLPLEYSGQSSAVQFDRKFSNEAADLPKDYNALRLDTYHQLAYPQQFFEFLNVVPRVGWRGTYYDDSWGDEDPMLGFSERYGGATRQTGYSTGDGGDLFRSVLVTGLDTSFKLSRVYDAYSEEFGINGIRHVVEPFMNFSYIPNPSISPDRIMQFDGRLPSTRLQPLHFPENNSIDSIDNQFVFRLGTRQTWSTRRNNGNWELFEWSTYMDIDPETQQYNDHFTSNLYNEFRFRPVPWMSFDLFNALNLYEDGFNELNTRVRWQVVRPLELSLGTRFIEGADGLFPDSNQFIPGLMWRINDNWSVSTRHVYEATGSRLEFQEYAVYRDLTSWRMAATAQVRDNASTDDEYLFYLSFTLKGLPGTPLPSLGYAPNELEPITLGAGPP